MAQWCYHQARRFQKLSRIKNQVKAAAEIAVNAEAVTINKSMEKSVSVCYNDINGFLFGEYKMIKNIFFDLDDTLFDFKMAEKTALAKTLTEMGVEPTEEILSRYSIHNISQWKRLELGEITREQVKVNRYRLLFDEFGIDLSPEKATKIYEKHLACGHWFIDGAPEILKALYKNYRLYLVSNGSKKVQDGRLKSSGITKYFDEIFISEAIGFEKPNIEFFTYCFERIPDFSKGETVIVGDSLSSDIKGGSQAGIKTVWFNPHHQQNTTALKPDYEISSLNELTALLKFM